MTVYQTCDKKSKSGKECNCQSSSWATHTKENGTEVSGYFCNRCGAYRGLDGSRKGIDLK